MGCEKFCDIKFNTDSKKRIEQCNDIIDEYMQQGLKLTLRQLYYQLVSRNIIPNSEKSYKALGKLASNARLAGEMDWDAIEDRARQAKQVNEYENLDELARAAISSYRLPRWRGQENYAELWVEKDALAGVLQPLAREFHVTMMVNKGYSSTSAMYESSKRYIEAFDQDKNLILFYLGDHDPSGEDMVRDIGARLETFGATIDVRKLALTMAQVKTHNPPPNPTKLSDSRADAYIAKFGTSSWEVDALPPNELAKIIRSSFRSIIDIDLMNEVREEEEKDKELLIKAVQKLMKKKG